MCDRYYKVRQNLLQGVTSTTKCGKRLLQRVTIITKLDVTIDILTKTCCSEITTFTFLSKKSFLGE